MVDQLNIAVLASGKGSNFKAILEAIKTKHIRNTQIVLAISNNPNAGALTIAHKYNIPTAHLNRKNFESDEEFNKIFLATLRQHEVNFIVLAGYMKKLASIIVREFKNRIINIHPALLPSFGGKGMYGMNVHHAVIDSKTKFSGATVHIVDEEYDHGPIVLQKKIEVSENETVETLADKVLKIEHEIYPEAIRLFAEGRVKVDGQHLTITR